MKKTIFIGAATLCLSSVVLAVNPINDDIVIEIKAKTTRWIPHEPSQNPLKDFSHEQLQMLLGTRIVAPLKTLMPTTST
jgi:hypothetical protein